MLFSPNQYNPCYENAKFTFNDFITLTQNPIVTPEKEKTLMFAPFIPKEIPELSFFSWEYQEQYGYKGIRKVTENFSKVFALVLDYDDGDITISDWIELHSKYKWQCVLYTTHSHSPELYRFRVVIPFIEAVQTSLIWSDATRKVLKSRFEGVDGSSFSSARYFYSPSHKPESPYEWKVINNDVCNRLDFLSEFENEIEKEEDRLRQEELIRSELRNSQIIESKKPWYILKFNECYNNLPKSYLEKWSVELLSTLSFNNRKKGEGVHSSLLKINANLYHNHLSEYEIMDIMLPFAPDDKTRREINEIVKGRIR